MVLRKPDASQQFLNHVERARGTLENFRRDGVNADGVIRNPFFQTSELKKAREELNKAIAILVTTKWH